MRRSVAALSLPPFRMATPSILDHCSRRWSPATSEADPKRIRRTRWRRETILCAMDSERLVERYFDAWIAHDAPAIVSTFADGGTYSDPTTPVALVGDAIGEYA